MILTFIQILNPNQMVLIFIKPCDILLTKINYETVEIVNVIISIWAPESANS